ncbi:SpaN/EivJ family type III secretion system needle length determinant [Serratia silvae]|uniref:Surface presentation of antigen domain-containing protein n=1 Tax=Serratia silvae TaxID=2824122 RepID=A0ABT0K9R7_9GAMM|nr:hypothetical protein [Serratia silvae]MCL1028794.1 hypothetical protein [Serratia silvae]
MSQVAPAAVKNGLVELPVDETPSSLKDNFDDAQFWQQDEENPLAVQQMYQQWVQHLPPLTIKAKTGQRTSNDAVQVVSRPNGRTQADIQPMLLTSRLNGRFSRADVEPMLVTSQPKRRLTQTDVKPTLAVGETEKVVRLPHAPVQLKNGETEAPLEKAVPLLQATAVQGKAEPRRQREDKAEVILDVQPDTGPRHSLDGLQQHRRKPEEVNITGAFNQGAAVKSPAHDAEQGATHTGHKKSQPVTVLQKLSAPAEVSSKSGGEFKYQFSRWGGDHHVNVWQPSALGAAALQPSDLLVQQRLFTAMNREGVPDNLQRDMQDEHKQQHSQQDKRQQRDQEE